MSPIPFIETLEAAAKGAAMAETTYRREAAERIRHLERERSFAYRRVNLMKPIADAVARAESEEMAVGAGQAIVRSKLGWSGDSEARSAVLTEFAKVAQVLFVALHPTGEQSSADVLASLTEFEAWYEAANRRSFWDLFDQPMPETPLVDF